MEPQAQRLGHVQAIRHALELRKLPGMSYPAIASVMARYHGFERDPAWWRYHLRASGAPPEPRGDAGRRMLALRTPGYFEHAEHRAQLVEHLSRMRRS